MATASTAKIRTTSASDRGPNDPATAPAATVPAEAPTVRHAPFTSTSPRLRAPLQTRNAVSTTQDQWSGHRFRPTTNAAASATAICNAIRVLAGTPLRVRAVATATAAGGGLRTRPMRCAAHVSSVPQATANRAVTAAHQARSYPPTGATPPGTTSTATRGSTTSVPARVARAPNRRTQIAPVTPRTNTASPTSGWRCISVLSSVPPNAAHGSTAHASSRSVGSKTRCTRPSAEAITTACTTLSTCSSAVCSTSSAQPYVPSTVAMVTAVARRCTHLGSKCSARRNDADKVSST